MILIAGLGNPGDKFKYTRHNIGFMVVERFVKDRLNLFPSLKAWKDEKKFTADVCKLDDCILVKPQTYMNLSGMSVARAADFYKVDKKDIWVVHDDMDLPLGKIKIRRGGASAGHHGVDSVMKETGFEDFVRFRLGIGHGKSDINKSADVNISRRVVKDYVLSLFRENEAGEVKKLIKNVSKALELALKEGVDKAMNRYN